MYRSIKSMTRKGSMVVEESLFPRGLELLEVGFDEILEQIASTGW